MTIIVDDAERRLLEIEEDNSVGNAISFRPSTLYRDELETMHIEIDNPWSGDTENGFGSSAYITVSKPDAARLAKFLDAWSKT